MFEPPYSPADQLETQLRDTGHTVIAPGTVRQVFGLTQEQLNELQLFWRDLPPDAHLRDGGRYRFRRHASFIAEGTALRQVPHRAHWQPLDYIALHGGIERWFEPADPRAVALPAWSGLLLGLAGIASRLKGEQTWFIEAHQFRIDTTDGIGRPTPEGAHRDGVDLVAVFMVARDRVKGGETRVFEADGPNGQRFTLSEPWSLLLLDDERVIHESTPIQPLAEGGYRDTLVVTLRAGGFQGEA